MFNIKIQISLYTLPNKMEVKLESMRENLYGFCELERKRYHKLYEIIEKYATEHKLLISDVYKLTNLQKTDQFLDYHYEVYCSRPLEHTNRIVNLIYEEIPDHPMIDTLTMNTVVKNEEFSISFDGRFIAKIFAMQRDRPKGKSVDLAKLVEPKIISKIPYMPAEIEIIDVFHKMYTASAPLETLEHFEKIMIEQVTSKVGGEVNQITGGKEKSCYERKKDELEAIKVAIVKDFLRARQDIALLGPMAIEWYQSGENICPKYDRIQLCGVLSVEQLKSELTNYLQSLGRKYEISMSEELDLLIPKDFRTKRTIFSMSIHTDLGIKEKPFLEYFNSCEFELIPTFEHHQLLLVSKPVLMRFLFIDLWISKFIYSIGKLDKQSYTQKQTRTLDLIKQGMKIPFVADGTLGVYYDYDISKKEKKIGQEQFFGPYMPSMHFKKNNKLREI